MIEYIEYWYNDFDEDDISKKIIDSKELEGYEILTDTGFKPITHIHKTQPYKIWKIKTESGKFLECADNHIVFTNDLKEIFVKDLQIGDLIYTIDGYEKITYIKRSDMSLSMYDVTVDSEEHRYYSNGILSHNTVISSIFLVWYLLFNVDRNVLLIANKGDTVKEIMDKSRSIVEHLPFFLKPGMLKKDVMNMKFDNGCRILGKATTKTSSIGFTVHLLYSDEFAHIPANILNKLWKSMYPTLSSSKVSKVIITSTPNGFNLFHTLYQGSVDGVNSFVNIFVPWWFVKGRDEAWRRKEIANFGSEEAFNQEYGCQFLSTSDLLLNYEELTFLKDNERVFHLDTTLKDEMPVEGKDIYFKFLNEGDYIDDILNKIVENNPYIIITVDTSEGIGGDYSVINLWNVNFMSIKDAIEYSKKTRVTALSDLVVLKQVGIFSDNKIAPDKFAKLIYWLVIKKLDMETTRLNIEANTFGGEVIRTLYNLYGENNEFEDGLIFKFSHRLNSEKRYDGNKLSNDNKIIFCNNTKKLINEKRLIPMYKNTISQGNFFARNKTGSYAASTGYDDEWMTVVHAAACFNNQDFFEYIEEFIEMYQGDLSEYEDLIEGFDSEDVNTSNMYDDFLESGLNNYDGLSADDMDWF